MGEIAELVGEVLGVTLEITTADAPLREGLERTLRWIEANQARVRTDECVI